MTHATSERRPWWRARWLGLATSQPVPAERPASGVPDVAPGTPRSWRERVFSRVDPVLLGMLAFTIIGLALRVYGVNWDANNHLHPDERAIVFKSLCLAFPGQPRADSCDPATSAPGWFFSPSSPLNPHFFAYGSFPLYLLAIVANGLAALSHATGGRFLPTDGGVWNDFNHFTLVGRVLSALFDAGSILLSGLLARKLAGPVVVLLAAAFVMVIPLDIQVSHFYAVDTILLFFVLLTLFCAVSLARATSSRAATLWGITGGIAAGLAIATKVSALPLALPIALAAALLWRRAGLATAFSGIVAAVAAAAITFAVTSPYALIDYTSFKAQVTEQTLLSQGKLDYPYVRQFADTAPYLYPIQQMLHYNVGIPLALVGIAGFLWAAWRLWRSLDDDWLIIVGWVVVYFAIVGGAYMKFSRYMLPIYAPLAILGAAGLVAAWRAVARVREAGAPADGERLSLAGRAQGWIRRLDPRWGRWTVVGAVMLVLGYTALNALAIDNLYSTEITRVQASLWIFDHIPPGTVLTNEIWDDPLPISAPPARVVNGTPLTAAGHVIDQYQYQQTGLDLYNDDTTDKAVKLAQQLDSANVVVISSQRLLKSIPKLPDRYPMTIRYYQLLFAGKLGFTLTKTFSEQPHILGY
ncbi:MAG TPA: phospholipid carrier-dependent glycosyltransferase, partial [Ktedonobacterales bacterium]